MFDVGVNSALHVAVSARVLEARHYLSALCALRFKRGPRCLRRSCVLSDCRDIHLALSVALWLFLGVRYARLRLACELL